MNTIQAQSDPDLPPIGLRRAVVTGASLALAIAGLSAGTLQITSPNPVPDGSFGSFWGWTWGMPDVTGDQVGEVLVSAPWETVVGRDGRAIVEAGRIYVYNGATGGLLYTITSRTPTAGEGFAGGWPAGDVNGDGIEDIMVGDNQRQDGILCFYDGSTGQWLFHLPSPNPASYLGAFGCAAGKLEDVNRDGHFDWLVGEGRFGGGSGKIYVIDGFTRGVIWSRSVVELAHLGFGCRSLPDLNGDGAGEVAVGFPFQAATVNGSSVSQGGYVNIISGSTNTVLYKLTAPGAMTEDRFGERLECLDDIDGDTVPDLAVGSHFGGPGEQGRVWIFSGASGEWIRTHKGSQTDDRFGWAIKSLPDQNGDGVGDLWILSRQESTGYVMSGATGARITVKRSPGGGRFWLAATTDHDGRAGGALVFCEPSHEESSGRIFVVSERTFPLNLRIQQVPGARYRLSFQPDWGKTYALDASSDGVQWEQIDLINSSRLPGEFVVETGTPRQLFRVRDTSP